MNLGQVMKAPGDFFASPQELINCSDFSPQEKIAILKQWEDEEMQLSRAGEENMQDDSNNEEHDAQLLTDIRNGIVMLEHTK